MMLQLRRLTLVLVLLTVIFVFFATLHTLRSGDGGWLDWKWPGSGGRNGLLTALACKSDLARDATPLSSLNTSFRVPADIVYDPKGPRADQIVILTATDGGGHNDATPDILEQTTSNRKAYCDHQGYRYHFVNISKFDLDGAHPVWKKLPAIVDAFNTYPDAQWVWMLDLDAIIMTPSVDLREILLSKKGMEQGLDFRAELHQDDWKGLGLWTPEQDRLDFDNIDFLVAQDHNGVNAGSFFVRRSNFSRFFLDMWGDPFFRKMNWKGQEQDALLHFIKHHNVFREHLGIMKQRVANAYSEGNDAMAWHEGDLVVHFAGCWVNHTCKERWDTFWAKKSEVPTGSSSH